MCTLHYSSVYFSGHTLHTSWVQLIVYKKKINKGAVNDLIIFLQEMLNVASTCTHTHSSTLH
jgi:hypothetical protein